MHFRDRSDAGRQLAAALRSHHLQDPVVLGIPRGGVPVACEVARALRAPVDVWIARKLGLPGAPEVGFGAVAEGGTVVLDDALVAEVGLSSTEMQRVLHKESDNVRARVALFRRGQPPPELQGRTVILVDDGVATGGTARAALRDLRARAPGQLVLAVPVGAADTLASLRQEADLLVCPFPEPDLGAVGAWYQDFQQVPDDDVLLLLRA